MLLMHRLKQHINTAKLLHLKSRNILLLFNKYFDELSIWCFSLNKQRWDKWSVTKQEYFEMDLGFSCVVSTFTIKYFDSKFIDCRWMDRFMIITSNIVSECYRTRQLKECQSQKLKVKVKHRQNWNILQPKSYSRTLGSSSDLNSVCLHSKVMIRSIYLFMIIYYGQYYNDIKANNWSTLIYRNIIFYKQLLLL